MNITSSIDNSGKVTSSEVIGIYSLADIYINSSTFFHNSPSSMVVVECHKNLCDTTTTSLVVNNSHFISNIERVGGGLHISKYMFIEIYNSIFTGNRVTNVGGVLYILFSTSLLISNCTFLGNNAARHGGVIYLRGVTGVSFHLSTFTGNNAVGAGGAVVIYSSDIVLINHCTFLRNGAHTGGALYLQHIKFVNVTDSNFSLNRALSRINIVEHCDYPITADREGGAIRGCFINHMKLNNCVFSNNAAAIGGAISTYAPIGLVTDPTYYLTVINSSFINNSASQYGGALSAERCSVSFFHLMFLSNKAKLKGGGLRIIGVGTEGDLFITHCTLTNNTAPIGGAMALKYASITGNILQLSHLKFILNHAKFKGGAIAFVKINNLIISVITLTNCSFTNNEVTYERGKGGALALEGKYQVIMNYCNFTHNNASYGGALYINRTSCFSKHCTFSENVARAGGAVAGIAAHIEFTNLAVSKNLASENGGGIALSNCSMIISGDSNFTSNTVSNATGKGGAIYIVDRVEDCITQSCSLFWVNNTQMTFLKNSASIGNVIYGGMLDRCISTFGSTYASLIKDAVLVNGSNYNAGSRAIISNVIKLCFCDNKIHQCSRRDIKRLQFPGQSLNVCVVCLDQMEQTMTCNVKGEFENTKFQIDRGENSRLIFDRENLTFHTFTSQENLNASVLIIKGEIFCDQSEWNKLKILVHILPCPFGFQIIDNRCQCDGRLREVFTAAECNIDTNLITIKTAGWFSYSGNYLRVHKTCPLNYCSFSTRRISPTSADSHCDNNHAGILCGGCVTNNSIILGSSKCMNCSNLSRYNFIWLIVVIALAGVVLVVFLLLFKMTISSGTINGLIFYANILSFSGLLDYKTCSIHPILRVFLSWINLDFGIEVCFYSGMNVYQKTWLQFVFPFYIWFLVGVIILFCRYSSTVMKLMGMRNIEVLATLFLLSYAKLLKTIVTALSFTDIMVASADNVSDPLIPQRVWVYDGQIKYLSKTHMPLFIVSLLFLVFLFLPYTMLLLFGHCLKRRGLRCITGTAFTSIMDSYHAPYTKHHRYWTGLSLLVRCCLFTIFGISYDVHSNLF